MARPFPVRKFASAGTTVPWAIVVAALLTVVWTVEWALPALQIEAGEVSPVNVRRPPRVLAEPADPADRTDYDLLRGEVVDPMGHADLLSWERDRVSRMPLEIAGAFAMFLTLLLLLSFYARRFGRGIVRYAGAHAAIFVTILATVVLFKAYLLFVPWSPYFFPLATGGLVLGHHLGRRAGMSVVMATTIVASSLVRWDLAFLLAGMLQALVLGGMLHLHRRRPRHLIQVGLAAGGASLGMLVAATFATWRTDLGEALLYVAYANPAVGAVAGAFGSGLLAAALLVPVGRLLGVVSRSRLLDLQDIEHDLLKRLRARAPGTWEHSRSMANLAEAAASAIGGNALLVRVGSYFHDVGKSVAPDNFIENIRVEPGQDHRNPHEGMEPKDSADRIVEHVVSGVERLRHYGIPEAVVDFAYMHHGESVIEYFWAKTQEAGNPHGYSEADFRYPGMRPQTRETGILMLVDAIEAASRTVQPPTREKFRAVVERIVLSKLGQGQLDESDLSFEDVHVMMDILVDALVHGHHERVAYPWQKKAEEEKAAEAAATPSPVPPEPGGDKRPQGSGNP